MHNKKHKVPQYWMEPYMPEPKSLKKGGQLPKYDLGAAIGTGMGLNQMTSQFMTGAFEKELSRKGLSDEEVAGHTAYFNNSLSAVSPAAGAAYGMFNALRDKKKGVGIFGESQETPQPNYPQPNYGMNYNSTPQMNTSPTQDNSLLNNETYYKQGGVLEYKGPSHANGGIPINSNGTPVPRNQATAEVEGGEAKYKNYIFSDNLKSNKGKTFADMSKSVERRYKGLEDKASLFSKERELNHLAMKNEMVKSESMKKDMNKMMMKYGGNLPKYDRGVDLMTVPQDPSMIADNPYLYSSPTSNNLSYNSNMGPETYGDWNSSTPQVNYGSGTGTNTGTDWGQAANIGMQLLPSLMKMTSQKKEYYKPTYNPYSSQTMSRIGSMEGMIPEIKEQIMKDRTYDINPELRTAEDTYRLQKENAKNATGAERLSLGQSAAAKKYRNIADLYGKKKNVESQWNDPTRRAQLLYGIGDIYGRSADIYNTLGTGIQGEDKYTQLMKMQTDANLRNIQSQGYSELGEYAQRKDREKFLNELYSKYYHK